MKIQPFRLERHFARYEFSAPYLLCSSDCESLSIADVLALESGAADEFQSLWLGYTESAGSPKLRDAIASIYRGITADQVLVHAGAEEAIFNFMNVALEPGDHIIVHAPYYQSLAEIARSIGADVSEWRGDPANAWALDLDDLSALLQSNTRLVVVNFPHNPTGYLPDTGFVQSLAHLADTRGFLLFADEVYRGLEHDADDRLPALCELTASAVSLGVMSKTYGLAGLRIGWLATQNDDLLRQLAAFKDYTTICNSAPSEYLATIALRHADRIVARNLGIIRRNLEQLDHFFDEHADRFAWYRPKAGPISFPTLRNGNVDEFCEALVQDAGVMLLPGTLYEPHSNAFRVGFGRKNLPEALQRFADFLARSPQ